MHWQSLTLRFLPFIWLSCNSNLLVRILLVCASDHNSARYRRVAGLCECYDGFSASDGFGNNGDTDDCGFVNPLTTVAACPGSYSSTVSCSGHGVCSGYPQYSCTCDEGWTGGDCSERTSAGVAILALYVCYTTAMSCIYWQLNLLDQIMTVYNFASVPVLCTA